MADSLNNINPRDLADVKDSLIIQDQTSGPLTTNIYEISNYVDTIKKKYMGNIPEDALSMGVFGFISEMGTNILENLAIMCSEYANEAAPTRAKFERNIIAHALSLGINKVNATPAQMEIWLCFPEDRLKENMYTHPVYGDDVFIFDKNFDIRIGNESSTYYYHTDYDIVIKRNLLRNGKFIYTATYILDDNNEISDITNPYLPNVGTTRIDNTNIIMVHVNIRQTQLNDYNTKILVTNPLESKSITFEFEDQLSYFFVDVQEDTNNNGVTTFHHLKCLYDGLYSTDNSEYCNYTYIDNHTIRIAFNRDSYQPKQNAEVTIHYVTTKGDECNFKYNETKVQDLNSNRFAYNNIYTVIIPITDSAYGQNRKSIEDLKRIIPQQMLMRNSITTYTDLNNYFNSLNTDQVRLYFLQKVHNQIQRLFFCYVLVKDNYNNILPTNSLDCVVTRELFSNINKQSFILEAGTVFFIRQGDDEAQGLDINEALETARATEPSTTMNDIINTYENSGFLYFCPFTIVINKNPFLLNYYLTILDYSKNVNFEWINADSELQFIISSDSENPVHVVKPFYPIESRDTYTISLTLTQNISSDFNMIVINEDEPDVIAVNNMKVIGVIYTDGVPIRWCEGSINASGYDDTNFIYNYEFNFTTNNVIDSNVDIMIESGLYAIGKDAQFSTTLPSNVGFKIFILGKFDVVYGTRPEEYDIDAIVPGLEEYTLCNVYSLNTGLDLFEDYTNIMESYIEIAPNVLTGEQSYHMKRVPLIRYSYLDTQSRVSEFISILDYRRLYIQAALLLLEDSFGIDLKFFNTYGPSKNYIVARNSDRDTLVDRVNISLRFEAKLQSAADNTIADQIIAYIKEYMENINYLSDLHIPNVTTAVKNQFYKQLVYFKFLELNDYGYEYQSIYKKTDDDDYTFSTTVPEFININTKRNDEGFDVPDITIDIIE